MSMKKAVVLVAAAGSALAAGAGSAAATSGAQGAAVGSPGVLSGNVVQIPINIPINLCGNTVQGIGALNPAIGNRCANIDSRRKHIFVARSHSFKGFGHGFGHGFGLGGYGLGGFGKGFGGGRY